MTEQSIGEILSGEPAIEAPVEASPVVEAPVEAVEAQPETVERPRGPDGKFIAKGEPEPETATEAAPPAAPEESGHIPIAALKDERSKRQAFETENAELRQQLARFQAPQPQPQAQPQFQQLEPLPEVHPKFGPQPDEWEDRGIYNAWVSAVMTDRAEQRAGEKAHEVFNLQRIQTSVAQFRADKPDYAEVISVFGQMAEQNPGLVAQMQQSANPAQFAYETAKLQQAINQHGSLQAYIDAQIAAKQNDAMQSVQGQLPQSAPPTLSHERSVGARSGPTWSGPTPLGEMLS